MLLASYVKFIFGLFIIKISNEEITTQSMSQLLSKKQFVNSNNNQDNMEKRNSTQETNKIVEKHRCYNFLDEICIDQNSTELKRQVSNIK